MQLRGLSGGQASVNLEHLALGQPPAACVWHLHQESGMCALHTPQVNLVGVLRVTQAFLPLLRAGLPAPGSPAAPAPQAAAPGGAQGGAPPTRRIVNISSQVRGG